MTKIFFTSLLSTFILIFCGTVKAQTPTWPNHKPPVAEKIIHNRIIHQDTVADPYYWMIDYFKKGPNSEKVISYLEAENSYTSNMLSKTESFQEELYNEMKNKIKEEDESVPVFKDGYYYYTRTEAGKQYYKYCRKKGNLSAKEEVLLDVDKMAEGYAYFAATGFQVSPNNKLLAFAIDTLSRRQYTIRIKDLETGALLPDIINSSNGNLTWANDSKTLFYTFNNPATLLSEKIKRHLIGTNVSKDVVVYEEKDNTNFISVSKSKNSKQIFIVSRATMSSETYFIDASKPLSTFKVFQPRMKNVLYRVFPLENKFIILTNWNAKNFRLMECGLTETGSANWKELTPNRDDVLLTNVDEFKDFLVISERKNGLAEVRIKKLSDNSEYYLDFGESTYRAGVSDNPEYDSKTIRYSFSSLITPPSVYDYNMVSKTKTLMKQQEVVGGYNPSDYVSERLYATATDGTKIPVSIIYKKGFNKDGNSPLLLYAYGSYGSSTDASFNVPRLSLLNRGFAYAIAHIRGGQEMGRQWYEDGKMMKKKNTFTDFIDVGKFLVKEKYTSPQHLYAQGGSAGGLLMGAIVNMAPQLWNGVIAQVPFVDVVNTMLDESIPLTTNEFNEWGNPKEEAAYFYLKSYSPYENIEKKDYPNMLVTTGLHDSQVQYFEPAKWVAKLRDTKTGNQVLFLHTNMKFGHGGASGRFDYLRDIALSYAFLFTLEGIKK